MSDLYQEIILEEYQHPKNKGVLSGEKNNVKSVKKTNVGCGDEFTVAIQLDESEQIVKDIKWQGQGCAISTSSMSLLSELIKGKSSDEIRDMSKETLMDLLGLDEITPAREKCLLLSLRAVKGALNVNK